MNESLIYLLGENVDLCANIRDTHTYPCARDEYVAS